MSLSYWASLGNFSLRPPAASQEINSASKKLGVKFPEGYRDFLSAANGGEGFLGENYLILWAVEELADFNAEYEVLKYAPDLIFFGSDGGGEGYAFDCRDKDLPIVRVPFIGMDMRYVKLIAKDFENFMSVLMVSEDV